MENKRIDSLRELLQEVRRRPAMWIGRPSVELLHAFLQGFLYARPEKSGDEVNWLRKLSHWIAVKFEVSPMLGWPSVIRLFSSSEAEELPLLWRCIDEFDNDQSVTS